MAYADNGSVRIYYQVEGEGPVLVLQHGFSESVVDWYESGYVEALRPHYRLILIDARGHGASAPPPAFCQPMGLLLHWRGLWNVHAPQSGEV
jgi:pimeloyl-ACP methyl ester carboxylesterase